MRYTPIALRDRGCILLCLTISLAGCVSRVSPPTGPRLLHIGDGWASTSINTVIFRRNSVVSHNGIQYAAYYNADSRVVLAKRTLDSENWEVKKTRFKGNIADAHNAISIMVDGDGYLHMSWDHHNDTLRYVRSIEPESLEMGEKQPMTGLFETSVTYPEFYRLADGNLLFFYRDGASGKGNLMVNRYDTATQDWTQVHAALIHGEGERNAYWQICTDTRGTVHISWVWRETADVATNHDIGYAKSDDGGTTWRRSNGETYNLPITVENAEYAVRIPQAHELINSTSMSADHDARPYIASYWRAEGEDVPQYHLVFHDGEQWHTSVVSDRETPFRLSGTGTKRVPISRPQILAYGDGNQTSAYLLFRDSERGDKVSVAHTQNLISADNWMITDLTDFSVGMWEPTYDTELFKQTGRIHILVQRVRQGDGESKVEMPPQAISILEWSGHGL